MEAKLNEARQRAGFTKAEMAVWFGVSRQSMWQWLAGERSPAPEREEGLNKKYEALLRAIEDDPLLPVPKTIKQFHRVDYVKKVMGNVDGNGELFGTGASSDHGGYTVYLDKNLKD